MSAQASVISSREMGVIGLRKAVGYIKYAHYVIIAMLLIWAGNLLLEKVQQPSFLPVNKIRIKGEMKYVTEAMLQQSITGLLKGGFFSTDVDNIQRAVETLPWVKRASVRRVWPETLFIQVFEQQPIAAWTAGGFVNEHGELFKPVVKNKASSLPVWSGPEGSEMTLYKKYSDFKQMLSATGLTITMLSMDRRHAIKLILDDGVELVLGRKEQLSRLQNFINIYKKVLAAKMTQINRVDLRYSNGMSIDWKVAPKGLQ